MGMHSGLGGGKNTVCNNVYVETQCLSVLLTENNAQCISVLLTENFKTYGLQNSLPINSLAMK